MKDYYDILEIPVTATPEQIKAQYRQLVRIYHPDRVSNPDDKLYAEKKLKQLNEAYAAINAQIKARQAPDPSQPAPDPIIEPRLLDFGVMAPGRRKVLHFQVGNGGVPARSITFTPSAHHTWFQVTNGIQMYPDKPTPIQFEVVANTAGLTPGDRYGGWVDIHMDSVTTRIPLTLQVRENAPATFTAPRWMGATAVTFVLLVIAIMVGPWVQNWVHFSWPFRQISPVVVSSTYSAAPLPPGVDGAAIGQDRQLAGAARQFTAPAAGWAPVFSPDGSQIAFLSDQLGPVQVFVRDPQSGQLRQLTTTPAAKSALAWSPDGNKLAFIVNGEEGDAIQIVEVETQTTYTVAPKSGMGVITHFLWAPTSDALTFDFYLGSEQQFYRASADGTDLQRFSPPDDWKASWPAAPSS